MSLAKFLLFLFVALLSLKLSVLGVTLHKITGAILASVAVLIILDWRRRRPIFDRNVAAMAVLLMAGIGGSIIFGMASQASLIKMLLNIVLYISVVAVATRIFDFRLILVAVVVGGMGAVATGLVDLLGGGGKIQRIAGILENPNAYGQACAEVMICLVGLAVTSARRIYRIGYLVLAVPALVGVLYSGSRSAFAALTFAMLAFAYFGTTRKTAVIMVGLIAIVVMFFAPQTFVKRWQTAFHQEKANRVSSAEFRLNLSRMGWNVFKQYPVFGVGPGNVQFAMKQRFNIGLVTHNVALQTLTETGAVGGIAFGFLFGTTGIGFLRIARSHRMHSATRLISATYFAWFVSAAVNGFAHGSYLYPHWYILFAVCRSLTTRESGPVVEHKYTGRPKVPARSMQPFPG